MTGFFNVKLHSSMSKLLPGMREGICPCFSSSLKGQPAAHEMPVVLDALHPNERRQVQHQLALTDNGMGNLPAYSSRQSWHVSLMHPEEQNKTEWNGTERIGKECKEATSPQSASMADGGQEDHMPVVHHQDQHAHELLP